jgi:hypothetical protein
VIDSGRKTTITTRSWRKLLQNADYGERERMTEAELGRRLGPNLNYDSGQPRLNLNFDTQRGAAPLLDAAHRRALPLFVRLAGAN